MPDSDPIKTASKLDMLETFLPDVFPDSERMVKECMEACIEQSKRDGVPINIKAFAQSTFVAGCVYTLNKIRDRYAQEDSL